jgi:hypothetical protein
MSKRLREQTVGAGQTVELVVRPECQLSNTRDRTIYLRNKDKQVVDKLSYLADGVRVGVWYENQPSG